jgi:hypothetical protein
MRKALLLLTPLLLTGCLRESATHYVGEGNEHTLTIRAEQEYFWEEAARLKLMVTRMPDCQRQFNLAKAPLADVTVELFGGVDNIYTVRLGTQAWQFDTTTCTQLGDPAPTSYGEPIGVFRVEDGKMVFEKVAAPAATPTATPVPAS